MARGGSVRAMADMGVETKASAARDWRGDGPNWRGLWTLYLKEVRRFMKVYTQTIAAPLVTTLLFFAIFTLALGGAVKVVNGVPFAEFLAPGLVMMAITQNAFANTSSSLVISKVQGNIVDMLMPPLSPWELTLGYSLAGATRGLVVGFACVIGAAFFAPVSIHDPLRILFFGFSAALTLSLIGVIGGIWSEKFDHIAAVTNFVVTPFAFLSGTFYSVERLPGVWCDLAHINPFFYMIDGFRSGFIGVSDADPLLGAAVMTGLNIALFALAWRMFARGYKLKA